MYKFHDQVGNDITLNGIKEVMYSGKLAENCFLGTLHKYFRNYAQSFLL